jgi:hypothetical protein
LGKDEFFLEHPAENCVAEMPVFIRKWKAMNLSLPNGHHELYPLLEDEEEKASSPPHFVPIHKILIDSPQSFESESA